MDPTEGLALIWAQAELLYGNFEMLRGELHAIVAGGIGFAVTYYAALHRQDRNGAKTDSRSQG